MKTSASEAAITFQDGKQPQVCTSAIIVEIANQQEIVPVNGNRLREGICAVLAGEGMDRAKISLAVVDDATIKEINARFLKHDWATDVISFVLEKRKGFVEGEIIISAETAAASASRFGWESQDELLLYSIHGALHLTGYDDQTADGKAAMREQERAYLSQFGLRPRYEDSSS